MISLRIESRNVFEINENCRLRNDYFSPKVIIVRGYNDQLGNFFPTQNHMAELWNHRRDKNYVLEEQKAIYLFYGNPLYGIHYPDLMSFIGILR